MSKIKDRNEFFLGLIHIGLGALILFINYGTNLNLSDRLLDAAALLPKWTLLIAGLVEGVYWLGGVIPGTTYMLFVLLVEPPSLASAVSSIALIWTGVASGMAISYASGRISRAIGVGVVNRETSRHGKAKYVRVLLGLHPTLAATHLFECGYYRRPFLRSFVTPAAGGLLALVCYVGLIYAFSDAFRGASGELGLLFGIGFVLWGAWRIASALGATEFRRRSA